MTNNEAINWLINIHANIGKTEHQSLWHYEKALTEIIELLSAEPEQKQGYWTKDDNGALVCSECEGIALQRLFFSPCSESYEMKFVESKFCPNCGVKMGDEKNGRDY